MYKNKTKDELLLDVYRLEVSLNRSNEVINKQKKLIDDIAQLIEEFKQKGWLSKVLAAIKLIAAILELIKAYKDDTRRA